MDLWAASLILGILNGLFALLMLGSFLPLLVLTLDYSLVINAALLYSWATCSGRFLRGQFLVGLAGWRRWSSAW